MKKKKINLYLVFLFSMVFLVVANTTELNFTNITDNVENFTLDSSIDELDELVFENYTLKIETEFENFREPEESENNIFDFSLNNNNGTPTTLTHTSSCKFGSCYDFNSNGDKIFIEDSDILTFADGDRDFPFTILAWVYMEDASNFQIAHKMISNQYAEYSLYTNATDDYLYFVLYDNYDDIRSYITTNVSLTAYENQWIYVVATYNGTGGHNGTKIYINGIEQNTTKRNQTGANEFVAMHNEDCPLLIGYNQNTGHSANGKIDEFRLYNKSMSQKEISALYNLTNAYAVSNYSFTRTDSQGYYNYTFSAPAELGEYEIKVNSTLNSVFGMANHTLLITTQGNAPPEILSFEFNTDEPSTSTNLECKAIVTDAETQTLTVEYWWVNQTSGSELYFSGNNTNVANNTLTVISTLPHLNTTINEIWNCTIRVYDSAKYSENTSIKTQIVNILPNITTFSMLPLQPNTTSTLGCYATVLDESNTTPNVHWYWYNLTNSGYEEIFSGTTIVQNNSYSLITQLGLENTTTGETWNCTIRAYDGLEYSRFESRVSVINTPPQITLTSLIDNYNETANISCIAIVEDAENTSMKVEWFWYNLTSNGYEEKFNGNTTVSNSTLTNITTLGVSNTTIGETWNCSLRVFDGSNKTSFVSSITKITSIPNITFSLLSPNEDSDLECLVIANDDLNATFNIEYYWYNQTTNSELMYKGNITITNNTNMVVATLDESLTTNDEIWNCTIRVYDGYGYSNFTSHKRLVDKQMPIISLNYPNASQVLTQHKIEINYTLNESNLNYTWYTHDYNGTKVELNYDTNEGNNLENITFAYPGKHIFTIYINDTFGNTVSDSVTFFIVDYLNVTEWSINYNHSQSNVTWLNFLDTSGNILIGNNGNITLDQNISLEINMTNITVYMYNFFSHEVIWDLFFEMYDDNLEVISSINTNYGKQPIDYAYITNFSKFNDNSSKYYGKVVLPSNNYDYIYYCAQDDLEDCVEISQCTYNYTRLNTSACYIDINSKYHVYVPHFSAVIGANDTVAPTISFSNPINNSIVANSYRQNISFTVNEQATCMYSFNENTFALLGTGTSFIAYINYTQNSYRNVTIKCEDPSDNLATSQIFYRVNDTSYPFISGYDENTETDEISISFNTDESANATILLVGTEVQKSALFKLSHAYTFSNLSEDTDYTFNITLCDRLGNCHTTQETESTDSTPTIHDGGSSSGGSSGSGSTSTSSVVNQVFFSLSEGEHYINIASEDIAITRITFTMKNTVNGSILFTLQQKEIPSNYPGLTNPYQYIYIGKTIVTDDDISSALIKFRVENTWIEENNINSETISLYRYTTKWNKLSTKRTSSDLRYTYYEANSPGFSYFGIKGEEITAEETIEQEDTTSDIIANVVDEIKLDDDPIQTEPDSKDNTKEFNPMSVVIPIVVLILVIIVIGTIVSLSQKSSSKDAQPLAKPQDQVFQQQSYEQSFAKPIQTEPTVEELLEIKQYVLLCRSEGVEENSIKKALIETGWQEKDVDHVMSVTRMPDEEIQMIIAYIKTLRQNNIPDEQIKQNLREVGWQEYAIQEAFKLI